jgi:hypothetical protein
MAELIIEGTHAEQAAHLLTSVDIGTTAPWAIHNMYLPKQ